MMDSTATTADLQMVIEKTAEALLGTLQVQNLTTDIFGGLLVLTTALAGIVMQQHGIAPDELFASIKDSIPSAEGRDIVRRALGARVALTVVGGGKHD